MKKNNRIHYLDALRILATLGVIIIHVSSQEPFYNLNVHTSNWQMLNFWSSISKYSVPLFVMISGVIFLDPNKKITFNKLFRKNIFRLLTALIFWQVFYAGYVYLFEQYSKLDTLGILIGGYAHLWFLPMIIGLYLIVPLLRKITTKRKYIEYYLILGLIFSILLPTFFNVYDELIKNNTYMPQVLTVIIDNFKLFINNIYFNFTLRFSTYFVAGYYFNSIKIVKNKRSIIYMFAVLGTIVTFLGNNILSLYFNKICTPFSDYMNINVAVTVLGFFVFFKELENKINWGNNYKILSIFNKISMFTFGIYLVHFVIVHIAVRNFYFFKLVPNMCIAVPLLSIIVFIISAIIVWGMSYIPWAKNHIM